MIYLIGSLRNPKVPLLARDLRDAGYEVFDDWFAAGPEADDYWQQYEDERGHTFKEALEGYAAKHVYEYDRSHLDRADAGVLLMPAGKSAHLELGYLIGQGKPGFILMDGEPERFDVMYRFATVVFSVEDLIFHLSEKEGKILSHIQSTGLGSTSTPPTSPPTLTHDWVSEWTKFEDFESSRERQSQDISTELNRRANEYLASLPRNPVRATEQTSSSTQEAISSSSSTNLTSSAGLRSTTQTTPIIFTA